MNAPVVVTSVSMCYYQRIPIGTLRVGSVVPFSLYLSVGEGVRKLEMPGSCYSEVQDAYLSGQGVRDLYIRYDDMDIYLGYLTVYHENVEAGIHGGYASCSTVR